MYLYTCVYVLVVQGLRILLCGVVPPCCQQGGTTPHNKSLSSLTSTLVELLLH